MRNQRVRSTSRKTVVTSLTNARLQLYSYVDSYVETFSGGCDGLASGRTKTLNTVGCERSDLSDPDSLPF